MTLVIVLLLAAVAISGFLALAVAVYLGTDFGAVDAWWGRIVARTWQNTVNDTMLSVKSEAERRATPRPQSAATPADR